MPCADENCLPAEVRAGMPGWLAWYKVPGIAIAWMPGTNTLCTRAYGLADAGKSVRLTTDYIFPVASLGKPVAACAALKLVAAGALDLDGPLIRHLPALSSTERTALAGITLRHALSHRSGLPNWRTEDGALSPAWPAGEKFGYSGEAYALVQHAMETATGLSFETLIRALVLEPCNMQDSAYVWSETQVPRYVSGHDLSGQPAVLQPYLTAHAAYTFHSTVDDYARFLLALTSPFGSLHTLQASLLQPEIMLASDFGWGLGFAIGNTARGPCLWHIGHNGYWVSFALLYPDIGMGLVLMANGAGGAELGPGVAEWITGSAAPLPQWLKCFFATFQS